MKLSFKLAQRTCGIAAVLCLMTTGCTSFRGPGEYKGSGTYQASGDVTADDSSESEDQFDEVNWKSSRQRSRKSENVSFAWPVEGARLTQEYKPSKRHPHQGIDLASSKGTPILAAEDGVVVYTGRGFKGYGKLIVIEHGPSWATLYSHLDKIGVEEGQSVRQGALIGEMGRTGRASGVHLHFEIRHDRRPVNPQAYLPNGGGTFEKATLRRPSSQSVPGRQMNRKDLNP